MPRSSTRRARAAAVVVALGLAAACSSPQTPPGSTPPPTRAAGEPVLISTRTIVGGLLPADVEDLDAGRVAALLFRGLVRYDERGKAVPEVARSIDTDDDRTFRVRLAPGWVFSDGTPVTSRSFVDAWNFAARPANGQARAAAFAPILGFQALRRGATGVDRLAGLHVVDDHRFTITLVEPSPGFSATLGDIAFAPLPPGALTDAAGFARRPIGNGPYLLEGEWVPGAAEARLRPSSSYAGTDSSRNAGLRFVAYTDPGRAYADLAAGRLDVLDQVPLEEVGAYRRDLRDRAVNQPVGRTQSLVFPLDRQIWAGSTGLARRTALSQALDRDRVAADVYDGTRRPATDLSAPVVEGHSTDACGQLCRRDPDAAQEALARAGGLPQPVHIAFASDRDEHAAVAALCTDLTEVLSLGCEPRPYPTAAALREAVRAGTEPGPYLETWQMRTPTLAGFLLPRFLEGATENGAGYADDVVQTRLRTAATAPLAQQPGVYGQIQDLILAGLPVVPLWSVNATGGSGTSVTGVRTDVFGVPVFTQIARP